MCVGRFVITVGTWKFHKQYSKIHFLKSKCECTKYSSRTTTTTTKMGWWFLGECKILADFRQIWHIRIMCKQQFWVMFFFYRCLFFRHMRHLYCTYHHHCDGDLYCLRGLFFYMPLTVCVCDETIIRDIQFVKLTLYSSPMPTTSIYIYIYIHMYKRTYRAYVCTIHGITFNSWNVTLREREHETKRNKKQK